MLQIDIEKQDTIHECPTDQDLTAWAKLSFLEGSHPEDTNPEDTNTEVAIAIVSSETIKGLNSDYRNKNQATNVLSFPAELKMENGDIHLGDIILCSEYINHEANNQHKEQRDHWAHMVIHGMLHLQGYDHSEKEDALVMETLEVDLLKKLSIANPYIQPL